MRTRLIAVILIPLIGVLLVLGGAFAVSAAHSVQQQFHAQQLGDLATFATSARQALLTGNAAVVDGEAQRYHELYGTRIVVVDRTGSPITADGEQAAELDASTTTQIALALSGRRGEPSQDVSPWQFGDAVLVEPVFDGRDVVGAVVVVSSTEAARGEILRQWGVLAVIALLATSVAVFVVVRLAAWVLKPVQRVDEAMEAIERGDMDARIADDTGPPELRRMILLFNNMAGEIERVMSRQQEFALNASHELRNPLNALLLRVEVLATGLGPEWHDDVEETREEGRRITRILDTLLSFARSGHGDASLARVDLARVAEGRIDAWRDAAARKSIEFELSGPSRVFSVTDRTIIESALDAIIDNAVKFSPDGSRIQVATQRFDGGGCGIVVRDHGPGLAEEELEHAAERFWRSAGNQNVPGSGLGLAIATDLLVSVRGRLTVAAPGGGGLAVTLRLEDGEQG